PLLTSTATLSTCAPSPLSLPSLFAYPFFFSSYGDPRDLHSFPTRRSSDLLKHYNPEMRIVLPGALPDPREARELTPYLQKTAPRSEEHTSELQSRENLVCRLLLEKKKKANKPPPYTPPTQSPDSLCCALRR